MTCAGQPRLRDCATVRGCASLDSSPGLQKERWSGNYSATHTAIRQVLPWTCLLPFDDEVLNRPDKPRHEVYRRNLIARRKTSDEKV